jgi:hypothetical protein
MTRRPQKTKPSRKPARKTRKVTGPVRPQRADPLDEFIAAGAHAFGLKIEKSWMPAVRDHLQVTLRLGALVAAFPLPDDAEPAPVFKA